MKCEFGKSEVIFLVHHISSARISTAPSARSPLGPFPSPDEQFAHVHVNITVLLLSCQGHALIGSLIDMKLFLCQTTEKTTANNFISRWVTCFGVLTIQTVDDILQSKTIRTTAYHPETNGLVERFHQKAVKDEMRCSSAELLSATTLILPGQFFLQPPKKCWTSPPLLTG